MPSREATATVRSGHVHDRATRPSGHRAPSRQGFAVIVKFRSYNGLARYDEAAAAARQLAANDIDPYPQMWALPELVEAAARAGETDVARTALDRLVEMTRPAGTDWGLGTEVRSRALLSDGENAELLYREAIERFGRTGLRPELARAHLL